MGEASLDLDELHRLGVYDPDDPGAPEVLEYLEWLDEQGFDVVELARTTGLDSFGAATAALGIRGDPLPLGSLDDHGLRPERVAELCNAFGFTADTIARGTFTPGELAVLAAADAAAAQFTEAEVLYFARVTAASLARMAEAAVALFMIDVEGALRGAGLSRKEEAIRAREANASLQGVIDALDPLFRLHMTQAIERLHIGANKADSSDAVRQAIGFVDLVGFSTWSAEISLADLSVVVREFEARADELITRAGARLVKTLGDAVMFTAVEPEPVARAAIALLDELGAGAGVEARCGLTYGDVIVRGGDYYGPIVNLASRLGDLAVPGELLATPDFADHLPGDLAFEPAGLRQLRGFPEPVRAVSLLI